MRYFPSSRMNSVVPVVITQGKVCGKLFNWAYGGPDHEPNVPA